MDVVGLGVGLGEDKLKEAAGAVDEEDIEGWGGGGCLAEGGALVEECEGLGKLTNSRHSVALRKLKGRN